MGGFKDVDEAMIAGARITDADIATAAAIKPLKVENRTMFLPVNLSGAVFTGTSVAISNTGVFPGVTLPNANSGTIVASAFAPRSEMAAGSALKVHVWWVTAATSGSARLVVDIKPAIEGISGLGSAIQRAILSDAQASANLAVDSVLEFPQSVFNNNQAIGLKISRDPDNSLDSLAADIVVIAVMLEFQGRC